MSTPHDPYPTLGRILKIIPPKEAVGVDLDDPKVWSRPPVVDYQYLVVHWGGGPNPAGELVEEPELTGAQKWAVMLGRCKTVLRSWHAYHTKSRAMSAIAYCTAVPVWGRAIFRLRGHRHNGGQWGYQNTITHAVVLVMGYGQKATRWAWRTVGLIWFCSGNPLVVGHRYFNNWPQSQSTTSCPGDENTALIGSGHYVRALGVLKNLTDAGPRVKAVTLKLQELGYLPRMYRRYRPAVSRAVAEFQRARQVSGDKPGTVGEYTWFALADA